MLLNDGYAHVQKEPNELKIPAKFLAPIGASQASLWQELFSVRHGGAVPWSCSILLALDQLSAASCSRQPTAARACRRHYAWTVVGYHAAQRGSLIPVISSMYTKALNKGIDYDRVIIKLGYLYLNSLQIWGQIKPQLYFKVSPNIYVKFWINLKAKNIILISRWQAHTFWFLSVNNAEQDNVPEAPRKLIRFLFKILYTSS
jgi:hypothetical protein